MFNRSLIQHLSFTVLRFVQPLMQLPTVNIIQKDVSSLRLSSRPRSRPALPPPLPSSWDWQGVNIGHIGECSSTTSSYFWLKIRWGGLSPKHGVIHHFYNRCYKLSFGCSLDGVYNIYAQRDSRFFYPLIISINLACLHDCIKVHDKVN